MMVDFPEPEGPTTKTNSPFSITKDARWSATTSGSYTLRTSSNTIIADEDGGRLAVRRRDVRPLEERGRRV